MLQCESSPESPQDLPTPELRSITEEQAAELTGYLRAARTQAAGGAEHSMAWSMINSSCEERVMVMQFVTASASFPLPPDPPVMREEDITNESVADLAHNPGIDIATINIAGPLIAETRFKDPAGTVLPGDYLPIHWPYHKGVVVNVEGKLRVLDLSVGDETLSLDDWAHSFVDESVPCYHLSDEAYDEVRIYWNSVMSPLELPERPKRVCGYTLTPIFRFRRDQNPLVDQIRWTPSIMETQCEAFSFLMSDLCGITVNESEIPFYACQYAAQPEEKLCEWMDLPYCVP